MRGYTESTSIDKSQWSPGVWRYEPDRATWSDNTTGYSAMAVRHPEAGYWCGYVGVPAGHPANSNANLAAIPLGALPYPITYVGSNQAQQDSTAEENGTWWLGFNGGGQGNAQPKRNVNLEGNYVTLPQVREACCTLAHQLEKLAEDTLKQDADPTVSHDISTPIATAPTGGLVTPSEVPDDTKRDVKDGAKDTGDTAKLYVDKAKGAVPGPDDANGQAANENQAQGAVAKSADDAVGADAVDGEKSPDSGLKNKKARK